MNELSDINDDYIGKIIIPRNEYSRKGDNGIVLIVGGSRIYHGAPLLSSIAAFRSGIDLVYTAIPKVNLSSSRMISPDLIFIPFPDDKLTLGSSRKILSTIPKKIHSAAIGMGLSISKPASLMLLAQGLLAQQTHIIFDASALIPDILPELINTGCIVTPHAGEFRRLFGEIPGTDKKDQIKIVSKKAKEYGIVVVLKGYNNIISDGNQNFIIPRTTPAMTVGGTGDILSGLIAGFYTKYNAIESSILGLYFNGLAALRAYSKFGLHIMASDILTELPVVIKKFDVNSSKT